MYKVHKIRMGTLYEVQVDCRMCPCYHVVTARETAQAEKGAENGERNADNNRSRYKSNLNHHQGIRK